MNLPPARAEGNRASIEGTEAPLAAARGRPEGRVEIDVRPEFVRLSSGEEGLPIRIRRIEEVGRHKIVRAERFGRDLSIMAGEDEIVGRTRRGPSWRRRPSASTRAAGGSRGRAA